MRNTSNACRFQASAQSTELTVNSPRQARKNVLRPILPTRKLEAVSAMALATR
jgi:hypothetical protein